jgi:phage gp37-like protein
VKINREKIMLYSLFQTCRNVLNEDKLNVKPISCLPKTSKSFKFDISIDSKLIISQ